MDDMLRGQSQRFSRRTQSIRHWPSRRFIDGDNNLDTASVSAGWRRHPRSLCKQPDGTFRDHGGHTKCSCQAGHCPLPARGLFAARYLGHEAGAPAEYRGEFDSIATATPGYRLCEHMPMLAARTNQFNVLRSVHHGTPSHEAAIHWVLTGYDYPGANTTTKNRNDKPSVGSFVAKVKGPSRPGLPAYFCVPDKGQLGDRVRYADSHFLGMAYAPFESGPIPVDAESPYRVPQPLVMFRDMPLTRFSDRQGLLQQLDNFKRDADATGVMTGMDQFRRTALEMINHPVTQAAIDLSKETPETRQRFGSNKFGQRVLMARRLAEAGVPFTLVNLADNQDWDTHTDNFNAMKTRLLPLLDRAVATLLDELAERGLLDSTLVAVVSEFGRTPKINNNVGRDHWSDVFSVMLTGGGLKTGQVLGTSNAAQKSRRIARSTTTTFWPRSIGNSESKPTESSCTRDGPCRFCIRELQFLN